MSCISRGTILLFGSYNKIIGMAGKENILILIPLLAGLLIVLFLYTFNGNKFTSSLTSSIAFNEEIGGGDFIYNYFDIDRNFNETYCSECSKNIINADCYNTSAPVLGGYDMVEFFNMDDESTPGELGNEEFSSTHKGYTFYFKNSHNRELFDKDPSLYSPSYGGFCSYMLSAEYCPSFVYTKDCLGPSGNINYWMTHIDSSSGLKRLFLFLHSDVKDKFIADIDNYIDIADKRWKNWFDDESIAPIATNCYSKSLDSE